MRRIKSRNFILVVCGIFFFVICLCLIAMGVLRIFDKISEKNIQENIILKSSKIEVGGGANFVENTPVVDAATIKDFNIKLKEKGDYAKFIVELCNYNKEDFVIDSIVNSNISCNDGINDVGCDGMKIKGYVKNDNNMFNSNECINFVVDAQCIYDLEQETFVFINEYKINLIKFNNK